MKKEKSFLQNWNQSKTLFFIILAIVFAVFVVLNALTPYQFDDFAYMYSFETNERLTSVSQVVGSMRVHRDTVNGRIVAHSLVSLILMLPKWVFNILNALVYLGLGVLVYRICNDNRERNNLLLCGLFSAIWIFEPGFGDVNLWLDGSINYLWGHVVCLLFVLPFYKRFFEEKHLSTIQVIGLLILAFFAGAYSENASFAVIIAGVVFCILNGVIKKQKNEWYYYVTLGLAALGYIYLATAPATSTNHGTQWNISALLNQFALAILKYRDCIFLVVVFVILGCICIAEKKNDAIAKAGAFFGMSLVSNFVMVAASYYPDRSAAMPVLLLVIATGILVASLWEGKRQLQMVCILSSVIVVGLFQFVIGVKDIYSVNKQINNNKEVIVSMTEQGITAVVLPQVIAETKYSPMYNSLYLNRTQPAEYPNEFMARYYGLESILGE